MKTQVSHSPGPWERSPVSSVVGSLVSYGDISKGMSVCGVIPQLSKEVTEANADLIAAAPDMLEALILLDQHIDFSEPISNTGRLGYVDDPSGINNAMAKAAEAIRKAKGDL